MTLIAVIIAITMAFDGHLGWAFFTLLLAAGYE
jgi:hypothetical protein